MVFQSRMDCRSSGYQAPVVPHCPRSARGKRSARKKAGNHQMSAIDLLANLASKLLSERENLPRPCFNDRASSPVGVDMTVELERIGRQKSLKSEAYDQLSCNEDEHCPENFNKRKKTNDLSNHSKALQATPLGPAALFAKSEILCEDAISEESKFVGENCKIVHGFDAIQKCGTKMLDSTTVESHELNAIRSRTPFQAEEKMERDLHMSCAINSINLNGNNAVLVSSDNSSEVPFGKDKIHHKVCFSKQEDDMRPSPDKDSENSSECTPSVITNVGGKTDLPGKRMDYTRQRTQMCSFVKRKFFEYYSASTSDGGIFCEANDTWSSTKAIKSCNSSPNYHGANDAWSSTKVIKSRNSSPDYHVKLRIKSFEVPELVVEIPETTTVGSLKRTVLEAVNTILGGGLQLGVLLQGKRVTDDSKTLHQVGISHSDKLDGLCFTLEPNTKHVPEKLTCPRDPHLLSLGCATGSPDGSPPAAPSATDQLGSDATQKCVKSFRENDHDSVLSSTNASSPENQISSSLVLVAAPPPPVNAEALAMVPHRSKPKSKSCQVAQRRVRRPFSVAEVEALVQAVEKLGTGRWRDVKLCSFENEKHRTYVDLKDKWKTLVHTARISPQQRRGEPVPQGLLDRVLLAHAYWSQQQSKLQVKSLHATETLLLLP
ncbi:telomere repeat-binding protein 5-like [Zingiber officinale]|uniref:Telomere repeat-binding protein 5 n=1 Tax=Zingiber officinale TaxID=94328 RepID=A0A8J5G9Y8_ZINOF|nr:telomere repeat-binding protein 5-like [Zingiber officinale]KAG6500834.1 hypothetical protein ZIOFF_040691 [Zingiber officinale]